MRVMRICDANLRMKMESTDMLMKSDKSDKSERSITYNVDR